MRLWAPSKEFIRQSNINSYIRWLEKENDLSFADYEELWQWSVDRTEEFWASLFDYFNILYDGDISTVTNGEPMPGTIWFEDVRLSYAEHIFRNRNDNQPAILFKSEITPLKELSWKELEGQVASLQQCLKENGIVQGDRVAAYLPCVPEATVAFLATNSLGAVWSSCSPDFGTQAVVDRFAQIEPKVLVAVDHYQYGGKNFDRSDTVQELINAFPSVQIVILIGKKTLNVSSDRIIVSWEDVSYKRNSKIEFTRVPFTHPIWIVYSSGTTGLPQGHCSFTRRNGN